MTIKAWCIYLFECIRLLLQSLAAFHFRKAANTVAHATNTASPAIFLSWCPAVDWLPMSWPESLGVC